MKVKLLKRIRKNWEVIKYYDKGSLLVVHHRTESAYRFERITEFTRWLASSIMGAFEWHHCESIRNKRIKKREYRDALSLKKRKIAWN
jgi:hypothetical protein